MRKINENKIYRIIDANLNRTKEGLRVCEDIARFVFDSKSTTRQYKNIRHQLLEALEAFNIRQTDFIKARNVRADVGRASTIAEFKRGNVKDIFYANSQRAKESIRVLEEFTKLLNRKPAEHFKKLRYRIYSLEKDIVEKF